ncbi:MAG: HDOD domain-containing protein [Rhodocyclaceae bacterium]|nr:HDOD domain-containing protein [Rhodocyclaceae bacterium]
MTEEAISERGYQFFRLMESELASGELNFPTCMELGLRIRRALDDPESGVEEISRIISVEPLLAAHVVRLANSAMYRRGGKAVGDVRTAVMQVGVAAIRPMALALIARQIAQSSSASTRARADQLWRYTIEVAALAWALATDIPEVSAEQALYAGLVHRIGSFYLIARANDFPELIAEDGELSDLVRYWSPRISREVLLALGTPGSVADAVEDAEVFFEGWPPRSLSDVLYIASVCSETADPFEDRGGVSREALMDEAFGRIGHAELYAMLDNAAQRRKDALAALQA